jgi:hypothetical protein
MLFFNLALRFSEGWSGPIARSRFSGFHPFSAPDASAPTATRRYDMQKSAFF